MNDHLAHLDHPDLVARLRDAGCVWAQDEADLLLATASGAAELESMVRRRIVGEPLEQVLGWAAFGELRLAVVPGVFVPRRRTEALARRVIALANERATVTGRGPLMLDLCCGVGALGAAVSAAVPHAIVWASDLDPVATACAVSNLPGATVLTGDLFAPLPVGLLFDVIGMNAPYVPTARLETMPAEARDYEPVHALDGGDDGLRVHRRALVEARAWLAPGGSLATECALTQAETLTEIALAAGYDVVVVDDEDLEASVVVATARELR